MPVTDASTPTPLAAFRGPVTCRSTAEALTLSGAADDSPDQGLIVTFTAAAPADLPDRLSGVSVSALEPQCYRIVCGSRGWTVRAGSVHVHRDIAGAFYRAIPPRAVPLGKRVFLRLVLALAGSRAGKRLLLALRGR